MRAKNKLLNAALTVALTIGSLGVLYTPISATNALPTTNTPNVADISPAAVNTCSPGYQEGFDVINNKWLQNIGDTGSAGIQNSNLVTVLNGTSDTTSVITADTFSGDFDIEVMVTGISGMNSSIDTVAFWMQAIYDNDNYFGVSSVTSPSSTTITAISETGGVQNNGSNNAFTYDFPVTLKVQRIGTTMRLYTLKNNNYSYMGALTGITANDVYINIASSFSTSVSHEVRVKFDSFRHGCALPTLGEFEQNGGLTSTPVSSVVFNGKMYQFIGGWSSPHKIYMRATTDGLFDGNDADENWVHDLGSGGPGGETATEIGVSVHNSRLYLSVKGNDSGLIFTKSMGADEVWDSTWTEYGGKSGSAIAMATYAGRLYQVIKGFSSNNLYYRYTTDEEFDGSAANESWSPIMNQGNIATSPNAAALEVFNDRLYISVRGSSGNINYASTSDGEFDSDAADEYFVLSGGKTTTTPSMEVHTYNGAKLYQITKGNSTDLIYTRYFTVENGWSEWYEYGGKMPSRGDMTSFSGTLYQTVRGNSGNIFMRVAFAAMPD